LDLTSGIRAEAPFDQGLTTFGEEMAQLSLHINNTKKAPQFDGINYAY
jgi:hypothetical protein